MVKRKVQKDKQRSTKHTHKIRVTKNIDDKCGNITLFILFLLYFKHILLSSKYTDNRSETRCKLTRSSPKDLRYT